MGQPLLSVRTLSFFAAITLALTALVTLTGAPLPGDIAAMRAVQAIPSVEVPAAWLSSLGDWRFQWGVLGIAAAVVAGNAIRNTAALQALGLFGGVIALRTLDFAVKVLAESPRPESAFGVHVDYARDSFGFPSGHVYSSVLVFGALAIASPAFLPARAVKPWRIAMLGLVAAMSLARIAVGAHWPVDTAGGYFWGITVLAGISLLASKIRVPDGTAATESTLEPIPAAA